MAETSIRRPGRPYGPRELRACAGDCGRAVVRPVAKKRPRRVYCSTCLDAQRPQSFPCRDCGGPFLKHPSTVAIRCEGCRERRRRPVTRDCAECRTPFTQNNQQRHLHCSGCRAKGFRGQYGRLTVQRTCEQCGETFDAYEPTGIPPKRFCCDGHRLAWFAGAFSGERSPHWRGGTHQYGNHWRDMTRAISARDGHLCRACGRHERETGERHTAAHLIPVRAWDGRLELAHHPANLIALCRKCHATFDRNPATRYDYAIGDRPFWPEWTAQPVSLKVDQAALILSAYSPERLEPSARLPLWDHGLDRLLALTRDMAGRCTVYGLSNANPQVATPAADGDVTTLF